MLRSDTRSIDGINFITTELPVMRGLVLWAKLGKIISPALVHLRNVNRPKMLRAINSLGGDAADIDLGTIGELVAALGPAAVEAFSGIEPVIEQITRDMLVSTIAIVDGAKWELTTDVAINAALGGRLGTTVKLLWWVGRFNFRSFFPAADASGAAAPAKGSP